MARKQKQKDSVECPICSKTLVVEDHPTKSTHEVARCNCRGSTVIVLERRKVYTNTKSYEEEEAILPSYEIEEGD